MEKLKIKIIECGASFAGFSNISGKSPKGLEQLEYAVTVGVRLSDAIVDGITDSPTYTYFHHYRTVNTLIDQITLRGMLFIQECGYSAYAVPASQTVNDASENHTGILPHKTAAVMAGLGWVGRSGLFISTDYGPRVRLGTILTDMPLPEGRRTDATGCGKCRLCVESCPAMALTGNCWEEGCEREHIVDVNACSEFMNSKFKHIGRGSVCGICMKVCPMSRK